MFIIDYLNLGLLFSLYVFLYVGEYASSRREFFYDQNKPLHRLRKRNEKWFNQTIPRGYSLLNATKLVAEVDYTYQPAYKASFVNAINDVRNRPPYFWMWYRWNSQESEWKLGPVGADIYRLKPDEIVMWRYEKPSMRR